MKLGKTVAELRESMSSKELTEWIAYYDIDPFGSERSDLNSAIIAQTIANTNRGQNQAPYDVKDFMPSFEEKQLTPDQEFQQMGIAFGILGE